MTPSPKSILLLQKTILIDAADYAYLSQFSWCVNAQGYASANVEGKTVTMHRLLMNASQGMDVDHIDRNRLNNRRNNLRICTRAQNNMNAPARRDSSTGMKGIRWDVKRRQYRVRIKIDKKSVYLGGFSKLADAVTAYNEAATKAYGTFARLNEVPNEA